MVLENHGTSKAESNTNPGIIEVSVQRRLIDFPFNALKK